MKRDLRREALRDVHAPAGRTVDKLMTETFAPGDFNLPKPHTLIRQMNKARQNIRPQEPTSLNFEFNSEFLGEEFLVGDVIVGDERHLMFATETQLHHLQRARTWYMDGTFRVVKRPFTQLWSIHGFLRTANGMKQVPLLCVLMSRRRKQDYVAVLHKLLEIMPAAPTMDHSQMDFEAGLWSALREVFPDASLHGCHFHWTQAIQRHVQELGLQETYRRREGVHDIIRKLLSLPFLPSRDVRRAFNRLREKADGSSRHINELFSYVEDTWMSSSLWSVEEWCVYRRSVRTNNDTEGWHRRLNGKAGRTATPMYVLLGLLLQEAKLVIVNAQLLSEAGIGRQRRAEYQHMDDAILDLWQKYDDHEIVCEEFLRKVGSVYNL